MVVHIYNTATQQPNMNRYDEVTMQSLLMDETNAIGQDLNHPYSLFFYFYNDIFQNDAPAIPKREYDDPEPTHDTVKASTSMTGE